MTNISRSKKHEAYGLLDPSTIKKPSRFVEHDGDFSRFFWSEVIQNIVFPLPACSPWRASLEVWMRYLVELKHLNHVMPIRVFRSTTTYPASTKGIWWELQIFETYPSCWDIWKVIATTFAKFYSPQLVWLTRFWRAENRYFLWWFSKIVARPQMTIDCIG